MKAVLPLWFTDGSKSLGSSNASLEKTLQDVKTARLPKVAQATGRGVVN
jgi:hypothetical protein